MWYAFIQWFIWNKAFVNKTEMAMAGIGKASDLLFVRQKKMTYHLLDTFFTNITILSLTATPTKMSSINIYREIRTNNNKGAIVKKNRKLLLWPTIQYTSNRKGVGPVWAIYVSFPTYYWIQRLVILHLVTVTFLFCPVWRGILFSLHPSSIPTNT